MKIENPGAIIRSCPRLAAFDLGRGFTIGTSYRACGRRRCRCNTGMLHPYKRLVVRDHAGRWRWIKLRAAEYDLIAPIYREAYDQQVQAKLAAQHAKRPYRPARRFSAAERALHAHLGLRWHNGRLEERRDFCQETRWQHEYECLLSRRQQRTLTREAYVRLRGQLRSAKYRRIRTGQPDDLTALAAAHLNQPVQETVHAT